jgi:hypothetical protein
MNLGRHSVRLNFTFSVMYVKTVVIFFILLALGRVVSGCFGFVDWYVSYQIEVQ